MSGNMQLSHQIVQSMPTHACAAAENASDLPAKVSADATLIPQHDGHNDDNPKSRVHKRVSDKQLMREAVDYKTNNAVALKQCVAHLVCTVTSTTLVDGHYLLQCVIDRAFVRPRYWDGRCFTAHTHTDPHILSFLGSKTFAYVSGPVTVDA
jgi:hypothetical protein